MAPTNGIKLEREPDYGKRLIFNIIDQRAQDEPQREWLWVPRSSASSDGWMKLSFKDAANAVNHCAHKIVQKYGPAAPNSFPTIAYIGPNDVRYVIMMAAAAKAGYKALFISPRNSQEGQLSLFEQTDCHFLWYSSSQEKLVQPWLEARSMKSFMYEDVDDWFPEQQVPHFPYDKTFAEAEWDPLLVLHTSGSTGIPKAITCCNGVFGISDWYHNLPEWQGTRYWIQAWISQGVNRSFCPMPMFHAAGIALYIFFSIYWDIPIVLGHGNRPLTAEYFVEAADNVDFEATVLPPSIIEDLSRIEPGVVALRKLKIVCFGGGNLATKVGDYLIDRGVRIANAISCTECLTYPLYWQPDVKLWRYFIINPDLFGADWRKFEAQDNVFELVCVRKGKHPGTQGFFYTFPELDEVSTKDLFKPHPELANHWLYHTRADNIIVFSNGEKLNPATIEEMMPHHPKIKTALVFGSNRFQPGLLLEPVNYPQSESEAEEFIENIWPTVVETNKVTVAHGNIVRELILLAKPDKPFPRAPKGTVLRSDTTKLYQEEINDLYANAAHLSQSKSEIPHINTESEETLLVSILDLFRNNLEHPIDEDADFFSAGIDSLQVIRASRLLQSALEAGGHTLDETVLAPRVIYGNPTPRKLASYLYSSIQGAETHKEPIQSQQLDIMDSLLKRYTQNLPTKSEKTAPKVTGQTVILTGSTGMLGSYLLEQLAASSAVKKVVCLNRAEDGGVKQQYRSATERGLDPKYGGKTVFYRTDLSSPGFGLPSKTYSTLLKEADCFIHNAWPVNFNISIESFEPAICGARQVADFATEAAKRVSVVFISSIGSVSGWDTRTAGPVPEVRIDDLSMASFSGYGGSKLLASLVIEEAAKAGGFPASIIRVGQIAGPKTGKGAWNRHEWLPSIIASSLHLKMLPKNLGSMSRIDWLPVESVASTILEIAAGSIASQTNEGAKYFHAVNPSAAEWEPLALAVQEYYGNERIRGLVDFKEWLDGLSKSQSDEQQNARVNPAVKLIDTYQGALKASEMGIQPFVFQTEKTQKQSSTMRDSEAVTPQLMKLWCQQWGFEHNL